MITHIPQFVTYFLEKASNNKNIIINNLTKFFMNYNDDNINEINPNSFINEYLNDQKYLL